MNCWIVELLNCWIVELLNCWIVELLNWWITLSINIIIVRTTNVASKESKSSNNCLVVLDKFLKISTNQRPLTQKQRNVKVFCHTLAIFEVGIRFKQYFLVYSNSVTTFIFYVSFNYDIWFWLNFWVIFFYFLGP